MLIMPSGPVKFFPPNKCPPILRGMLTAASILSFGTGIAGNVCSGMLIVVVVVTMVLLPVPLMPFCGG